MESVRGKQNTFRKFIFGAVIGIILASLMSGLIFFLEKGGNQNKIVDQILIFLNSVPLVVLIQFLLDDHWIYPLVYAYLLALSFIAISMAPHRRYRFLRIIFLMHILFAIYYNLYVNYLVDKLGGVLDRLF